MEMGRRAGRPNGRPLHWVRWQYKPLMERLGMTPQQVEATAVALAGKYLPQYGRRKVYQNALDNPYMTEDARQTVISDMERSGNSRRTRTRPSQTRAVGTTINYPRSLGA